MLSKIPLCWLELAIAFPFKFIPSTACFDLCVRTKYRPRRPGNTICTLRWNVRWRTKPSLPRILSVIHLSLSFLPRNRYMRCAPRGSASLNPEGPQHNPRLDTVRQQSAPHITFA